jgi:hypothetical protein
MTQAAAAWTSILEVNPRSSPLKTNEVVKVALITGQRATRKLFFAFASSQQRYSAIVNKSSVSASTKLTHFGLGLRFSMLVFGLQPAARRMHVRQHAKANEKRPKR